MVPGKVLSAFHRVFYWAFVTVTTVGYGNMVLQTVLGKFISSIATIICYAINALPSGIIIVEMANSLKEKRCVKCIHPNENDAKYWSECGEKFKG
jgi:voltage-gated potassium channel